MQRISEGNGVSSIVTLTTTGDGVRQGIGLSRLLLEWPEMVHGEILPYLFDRRCSHDLQLNLYTYLPAEDLSVQPNVRKLRDLQNLLSGLAVSNKRIREIVLDYLDVCAKAYYENRKLCSFKCLQINDPYNYSILLIINGLKLNIEYIEKLSKKFEVEIKKQINSSRHQIDCNNIIKMLSMVLKTSKVSGILINVLQYVCNVLLWTNYTVNQKINALLIIKNMALNRCLDRNNYQVKEILLIILKKSVILLDHQDLSIVESTAEMLGKLAEAGLLEDFNPILIEVIMEKMPALLMREITKRVLPSLYTAWMVYRLAYAGLLKALNSVIVQAIMQLAPILLGHEEERIVADSAAMFGKLAEVGLLKNFNHDAIEGIVKQALKLLDRQEDMVLFRTPWMLCHFCQAGLLEAINPSFIEGIVEKMPTLLSHKYWKVVHHTAQMLCYFDEADLLLTMSIEMTEVFINQVLTLLDHKHWEVVNQAIQLIHRFILCLDDRELLNNLNPQILKDILEKIPMLLKHPQLEVVNRTGEVNAQFIKMGLYDFELACITDI